jgi:hypothetical protein
LRPRCGRTRHGLRLAGFTGIVTPRAAPPEARRGGRGKCFLSITSSAPPGRAGPGDVVRREAGEPRRLGDLRQIARWIGRHQQPAQVVIALMVIAASMLAMVIGMLVGAGVEPWLAP